KTQGSAEAGKSEAKAESSSKTETKSATQQDTHPSGRVKASPLAKKIAKEKGIDIKSIHGSGEHGRIVKKDIEQYQPSAQPAKSESKTSLPSVVGEESFEEVPVSQMRKTIAKRLGESKFTAPHFYLTMEINMDKSIEAR